MNTKLIFGIWIPILRSTEVLPVAWATCCLTLPTHGGWNWGGNRLWEQARPCLVGPCLALCRLWEIQPQVCMTSILPTELAFQYRESPLLFLRSLPSLQPTTLVDIHPTHTSKKNFHSPFCPVEPAGGHWMLDCELSGLISPISQIIRVFVDKVLLAFSLYLGSCHASNSRIKSLP